MSACSSKASGTLVLVTGAETDTFSRDPAPTQLTVESVDSNANATTIAQVALAGGAAAVDLGSVSTSTVARVRVTARDASGVARVFGTSLPVDFSALDGGSLNIFVQRTGELARMPAPLADARTAPILTPTAGRFLFVAGGTEAASASTSVLYDLATYSSLSAPPTLPRAPKSVAINGTVALLIDDQGATSFNLSDSSTTMIAAPAGGTYAEVSGGATVFAPDGSAYVVGATRVAGAPTARVLLVDPTGTLSYLTLAVPRLAAAATWVVGRGLVVVGGSADGAGAEILGPGATNGVALPYPSDASAGAGAATLDATHVLLAGGVSMSGADAAIRVLDLACSSSCAAAPGSASLAAPLTHAQAFDLDASSALVVGDDAASGATRAFRVSQTSAVEVVLKVPRKGGRGVVLPTGAIAIAGGAAEIESFVP